jgi:hypothetical protein
LGDKGIDFRLNRRFNSAAKHCCGGIASIRRFFMFTMNGSQTILTFDGDATLISAISRPLRCDAPTRGMKQRAFFNLSFARVGNPAACWFGHQAPPNSMVPQERSVYEQHRRRAAFFCHRNGGAS